MSVEQRISALGLTLQKASNPQESYANCATTGNLIYVSGKGPVAGLSRAPRGKLGKEYSVDEGYELAKLTGLDILAAVKLEIGSLESVARVLKIRGVINATEGFEEHPKVLDGCSDLFAQVFGERGVHARSVFGAASVRGNLPLVIDSIFEIAQ